MFKVTMKCVEMGLEKLASELDNRSKKFKVWRYDRATYLIAELKGLQEMDSLIDWMLKESKAEVNMVKIEKSEGQSILG